MMYTRMKQFKIVPTFTPESVTKEAKVFVAPWVKLATSEDLQQEIRVTYMGTVGFDDAATDTERTYNELTNQEGVQHT